MPSIFKGQTQSIFAERASAAAGDGRVQWRLRSRSSQQIGQHDVASIAEFGGQPGLVMTIESEGGKSFSYLRGQFVLAPEECTEDVVFSLELSLEHAAGVQVVVSLFDDANFTTEFASVASEALPGEGAETISLPVKFRSLPVRYGPVYGFVQVCLLAPVGAEVRVGTFAASRNVASTDYRPLRIRYDAFGDETKASSRLRVWKFVELLKGEGHQVEVGGKAVDVDLYVCQKVRPFNQLREVKKANPNAVIVYDFDDNFVLPTEGVLSDFLAFINHVDVVTCGSEYLAESARQWHGNVYVLENPLDIDEAAPQRPARQEMARIGWFGAPEGLSELAKAQVTVPVETVTRGGTIEYDGRTIDRDLAQFDLLLFPVEQTPWNLAKNANRMMKAVGLGIPVLASDTPEHRRFVQRIGLPESALCGSFAGWDAGIAHLRSNYADYERTVQAACEKVREMYSVPAILTALFDHIFRTTSLGGVSRRRRASSDRLGKVGVLMVDVAGGPNVGASFDQSGVDWAAFHSIQVISTANRQNELLKYNQGHTHVRQCDFLQVFAEADRFLARSEADYLLVVPPGTTLAYGAAAHLEALLADKVESVAVFARANFFSHVVSGAFGAHPLRDLMLSVQPLGPILVNTRWLQEAGVAWSSNFDLWNWAVAMKAFATGRKVQLIDLPFAFDAGPRAELNVAQQYATWLTEHQPAVARELPDLSNQWGRLMQDIVATAVREAAEDLPAGFAELQSQNVVLARRLARAESELKSLKAKK